jgi:hypothetical protein
MCLRGASAVQKLLESRPDLDVRVFVIWEPVIVTDIAPPTSGALARIPDARVAQFWDEGRVVSADIVRSVRADPARYGFTDELYDDTIIWDTVLLIEPRSRWEDAFPVPAYYGYPVATAIDGLIEALTASSSGAPSRSPS